MSTKSPSFRTTRWRESYDMAEVDAFLAEILPWLDARQPNVERAQHIRRKRFSLVRLRLGYDMDDVDEHLERLASLVSQGSSPR